MKKIFVILGILFITLVFTAGIMNNNIKLKEGGSTIYSTKQEYYVMVQVDEWKEYGLVGTIIDTDGVFKKDDDIIVVFNDGVSIVDKDNNIFYYEETDDEGNALDCPIDIGSSVYVKYNSWEDENKGGNKNRVFAKYVEEK